MRMLVANHWTEHGDPKGGVSEGTEGTEGVCMAPAAYVAEDGLKWHKRGRTCSWSCEGAVPKSRVMPGH